MCVPVFRWIVVLQAAVKRMKIAVIGQSVFGAEVFRLLQNDGHEIVGVFTILDVNGKADPLGIISYCLAYF